MKELGDGNGERDQTPGQVSDKPTPLREVSPAELWEISEDHRLWVATKGREGKRADLARTNLVGVDLREAQLQQADLCGANLQEATLIGANLQGACLTAANLQKAELATATLREANLQDANLTDTVGLLPGQLAGANVSGADLPSEIGEFHGLAHVEGISQKDEKLFMSMLAGCIYAWLTITTTTDDRIFQSFNESELRVSRE